MNWFDKGLENQLNFQFHCEFDCMNVDVWKFSYLKHWGRLLSLFGEFLNYMRPLKQTFRSLCSNFPLQRMLKNILHKFRQQTRISFSRFPSKSHKTPIQIKKHFFGSCFFAQFFFNFLHTKLKENRCQWFVCFSFGVVTIVWIFIAFSPIFIYEIKEFEIIRLNHSIVKNLHFPNAFHLNFFRFFLLIQIFWGRSGLENKLWRIGWLFAWEASWRTKQKFIGNFSTKKWQFFTIPFQIVMLSFVHKTFHRKKGFLMLPYFCHGICKVSQTIVSGPRSYTDEALIVVKIRSFMIKLLSNDIEKSTKESNLGV